MMAHEQKQEEPVIMPVLQDPERERRGGGEKDREFDPESDEPGMPPPFKVTSRVLYMLGDLTAGPASRFTQWLEIVRKRTSKYRSSGFPFRPYRPDPMPSSAGELYLDSKTSLPSEQTTEISLWERLGKAAVMDIESSSFSWNMLSSLYHTEHSGGTEQSEDDTNKVLEVTVNSGGVVFFALFNRPENDESNIKESPAVIKISSSRVATQSERLGYEFAKWLGVRVPQARVVHNTSPEWLQIKEAAEKAREAAISDSDEVGEVTCSELLEALELSRCLFLMSYVHGSPLMENSNAFESQEFAEKIAASLGRILMLDLVIRNEDRLPCRWLGWRGNSANLLLADKSASTNMKELCDSSVQHYQTNVISSFCRNRRACSVDNRLATGDADLESQLSDPSESRQSSIPRKPNAKDQSPTDTASDIHIYAIDSGVPRRPPAGKRTNDQENYPKLVELILNSSTYSSNLLHEITGGKLGSLIEEGASGGSNSIIDIAPVLAFRSGFRAALRDLQGLQIFLVTLHQKLDVLLRVFLGIINKASSGDIDREDMVVPGSPLSGGWHFPSPLCREHPMADNNSDPSEMDTQRLANKHSFSGLKESSDSTSPTSRECWHGRSLRGSAEPLRCLRLTAKLRDFHKYAKDDAELSKELEQWNDMLRNDAVKFCQDNNFNSGFFVGSDNNSVVDAYELKVRLEHILERISLICDAANAEKPSLITGSLFIGGALAARSKYTLQHLGVTHVLCLCSNEIGQSDSQYPHLFEYRNFSISDEEDSNISSIFEEACEFIDHVERSGGKALVHCFEGRSRSATMVLAYLMLRKNMTLLEAWNKLKKGHRRAQPNDGFARILLKLDKQLHGEASMEWQQRRPSVKVCPICGENAGLSSSSLKLHLQKAHRRLSSGSVDSAMTMEIQKAIAALKVSRGSSVSPTQRDSSSMLDCSIDRVD